jgi:hypothetical protein
MSVGNALGRHAEAAYKIVCGGDGLTHSCLSSPLTAFDLERKLEA